MRRNGYSLMEMVVVIAMLTMILMISSQIASSLWQINTALKEERLAMQNWGRLTQQFREDAHAAATVVTGDRCEFVENLKHVIYTNQYTGRIDREELRGDQVVARESYVISPHAEALFRQREVAGKTFVSLEIKSQPQPPHIPPRMAAPLRVESVVALRQLRRDAAQEAQP